MKEFLIENWILLLVIGAFDFIMKLIAMYRAAQTEQKTWYVILAILNTIGILPIIYLTAVNKMVKH